VHIICQYYPIGALVYLVPGMYCPIGAAGSASVSLTFIEFLRFEEILLKGAETGRRKASQL
jgi:hypothetical protein